MVALRSVLASILVVTIGIAPSWGATGPAFGTVVTAEQARVGTGPLSVGATVFGGDRLWTDPSGSVQVRAGAARLLLSSSSVAILAKDESSPSASLTRGTAIFSTANSKAFVLHVGSMVIQAETNEPTVAQVSVAGPERTDGQEHEGIRDSFGGRRCASHTGRHGLPHRAGSERGRIGRRGGFSSVYCFAGPTRRGIGAPRDAA